GRHPKLYEGDIRQRTLLQRIFAEQEIEAVIHFAALKAVGESVAKPLEYYENNLGGAFVLLDAMREAGVRTLVFSSSATVYGNPATVPIREDCTTTATSPYGWTKLMMEQVLKDFQAAHSEWSVTLLRYFNPVGAHPSGLMGEDPQGIPNNLMPYLSQVAVGRREFLLVYGDDYPTRDGTGVRDYIHVMDLADGHIAALRARHGRPGVHVFNLGTGCGTSVLDMVAAFSRAVGRDLPYRVVERRPGDIAECWADPELAQRELGWRAWRSLDDIMRDTWNWQTRHPDGYRSG
ncbi:MAG: UDP-glucose 4-epimerase GalE, partial [Rhodoferax sp.]|nr:UDP-glucose 4-epimerase GalE [Rhodoferax sp.]